MRLSRRAFVASALSAVAAPALRTTSAAADEPLLLRCSLETAPAHTRNAVVRDFLAEVEKAGGGRVKTQLFESGQLFPDLQVGKALMQGQIEIATWTEPSNGKVADPGWLAVSITDHGPGIPTEVLPRIFEAFFTTKPQGSGTGLGLEIVHRIVTQKFGGTIDVESQPGMTRFIVRLPVTTPNNSQPTNSSTS